MDDIERKMLKMGVFHVDGWTSLKGHDAVVNLERLGYITTDVNQGEQYTSINCFVTDVGRAALEDG